MGGTATSTGGAPSGKASVQAKVPNLRIVAQGKSAADVGVAFNPSSNEYVQTTRADAAKQGLQQFNKITAKEQDDNRQLNNRLADVATKLTRYETAFNTANLSANDKAAIASAIADDKFKLGLGAEGVGFSLPVDQFNKIVDALDKQGMSADGKKLLVSYYNARESMVGYQRVLSGSARSNERAMQLNLDALPNPVQPRDYANEALRQFKENLTIAGQGLPRMPGITSAKDVLGQSQSGQNQADQVHVQIPGQAPGLIPRSRLGDFQKKYPGAQVLQ
jgi:hypothetical protein